MPIYSIDTSKGRIAILSVHIPKTGGTSISDYFSAAGFTQHFGNEHKAIRPLMVCPPQHYHYDIIQHLFHLPLCHYSFAIVRHPLKRIISDYYWAMNKSTLLNKSMTINEWIPFAFDEYSKNNFFLANHIRPQHEFVGPHIKRIFKYEYGLDNVMNQVFSDCRINTNKNIEVPKINLTQYPQKIDLNSSTIDLVKEFYKQDFKLFDYDMNLDL